MAAPWHDGRPELFGDPERIVRVGGRHSDIQDRTGACPTITGFSPPAGRYRDAGDDHRDRSSRAPPP